MLKKNELKRLSKASTRLTQWGCLLLCVWLFLPGCMSTRGMMYLHPPRSAVYLSQEKKPTQGPNTALVESAVQKARDLLKEIPEGRRRLGGFCTEPAFTKRLRAIMDLTPSCRKKLQQHQNKSNLFGVIFWSLLGGTAVTGISGIISGIGGLSSGTQEGAAAGTTALVVLGTISLTLSLVNGLGTFSRIQDRHKAIGMQIDNYMWTLRRRISVEVCTASDRATGLHRLIKIQARITRLCTSDEIDDGTYSLPNK